MRHPHFHSEIECARHANSHRHGCGTNGITGKSLSIIVTPISFNPTVEDGKFKLTFNGDPERTYDFDGTTDFAKWDLLDSNNSRSGIVSFEDQLQTNGGHRFYRIGVR